MDADLRRLELAASSGDASARAQLAVAERRSGMGIQIVDKLPMLQLSLQVPWVDVLTWAAVRVGNLVHIVYPGRINELAGAFNWMQKNGVARIEFKDSYSRKLAHDYHEMLKGWVTSDSLMTVVECIETHQVSDRITSTEVISLTTERRRESWTVEHVRLAVGLDPIEPAAVSPPEVFEVMVGRCHTQGCSYDDARTRKCGHRLCFNCNRIHVCGTELVNG